MGLNDILPSVPWKNEDWHGWRAQLRGPPLKLLLICAAQLILLFVGLIVGIGRAECEVSIHGGADVQINCNNCIKHPYVSWQQVVLLLIGMFVIFVGVAAAIFRSKRMCKIYGIIMMIYAFVIGLTALLTGLDTIVLSSAVKHVDGAICKEYVESMINTTRVNSILYALNCIACCCGAIYAIKSKELFEFQEIASQHRNFEKTLLL